MCFEEKNENLYSLSLTLFFSLCEVDEFLTEHASLKIETGAQYTFHGEQDKVIDSQKFVFLFFFCVVVVSLFGVVG